MPAATLTIDLSAIAANWHALDRMTECETGAVVKADGYGLDAATVAKRLAAEGARQFFVALPGEGVTLRRALGPGPAIHVFSGHMKGDAEAIKSAGLTPMINSVDQMLTHVEALPGHPFGLQLDSGMNRLGLEPDEWSALRDIALAQQPKLIMSHLACADDPADPMNAAQLDSFISMTDGIDAPRSLAATGGILQGEAYHFDLTRPGIGLYGGLPFAGAAPAVRLDLPIIQLRNVAPGETVGYSNGWTATRPSIIATLAGGYADGLIRAMGGGKAQLWAEQTPVPLIGRVSMDLITADVTHLRSIPDSLTLIGPHQSVDDLAAAAGTIGYEILTSLGGRYDRDYRA
ncbi:MAG: alanine racemase [Sulfitobacter sp.]